MSEWIPSNPYETADAPDDGATLGDIAKSGAAGALDAAAQGASAGQYGAARAGSTNASTFFRGASELLHAGSDAIQSSETEGGKRAAGAKWLPEEGEASVADAPGSSLAMKGANMAPYLFVLSAFPESAIGAALAGGGLQAAQHIDAALAQTNRLPDDELQSQSPVYADLRGKMDENQARAELTKIQVQGKDLLAAGLIGAVANGAAAKALKGTTASPSVAKGAAAGAAEGGLGMGASAAETDYGAQQSQVNAGAQPSVNWHHVAMSGLEAMIDGGIIGGGAGAVHSLGAPDAALLEQTLSEPTPTKKTSPNVSTLQAAPELGPDATQAVALPTASPEAPQTAAAPEAPKAALPSEVTPPAAPAPAPAPSPAQVANDAGQNIPEAPATLQVQQQALAEGRKKAVLYPKGTETPATPEGMKSVKIKEGVVHFDPDQVKRQDVFAASKKGRLNELLDLGPANKEEVAARVQAGEAPVAVVERTPEGVEAKSAVGTSDGAGGGTAPDQAAALEQTKLAPENTVAVEPPQQVLQEREAAQEAPVEPPVMEAPNAETAASPAAPLPTDSAPVEPAVPEPTPERLAGKPGKEAPRAPRILEDVTPEGKARTAEALKASAAQTKANLKAMEKEGRLSENGPKGKNWTKAQKEAREQSATKAKELFDKHAQDDIHYIADQPALQKYQDRLQAISDGAKEAGVTVPTKVGYEGTSDHIIWLADVRRVLSNLRQKKGSLKERLHDANTLVLREASARDGDFHVMRSERRAEGEQAMRQDQGDVEAKAADASVANPREVEERMVEAVDNGPIKGRDRAPSVSHEAAKAAVTAGQDKAGTFKAETVKRRKIVPPKVGPKTEGVMERLQRARDATETNPTEAQKESGRYPKGRVTFEGNKVALENPKGSVRSGVDPDGKPWSVKMPGDYGEFVGTKGADGDAVDVLIGNKGETGKAFVVNQQDHKTGEFDEHKVVLGEKSAEGAKALYKRGFSDGKGEQRIQSVQELSRGELKEWLRKGDHDEPLFHRPQPGYEATLVAPNGERITPHETTTVDKLLGAVDWREHGRTLAGNRVTGLFAPLIAKRVRELVGDVKVHLVDGEEMHALSGGVDASGFYLPGKNHIVLNADHLTSAAAMRHVALHEALHAALYHALERTPGFKRAVRDLMGEYLNANPAPLRVSEADADTVAARNHYAFTDEHEFISEALSNPVMARRLANFTISDGLSQRLGLKDMRERSGWYGRIASGWDALVAAARRALDIPQRGHTALEAAMSIGERLMQERLDHPAHMPPANELIGEGARPAFLRRRAERVADDMRERAEVGAAGVWRHAMDKMATLGMLSRSARELFGPSDPMRRVYELRRAEAVEKQQILEEHGGADLTNRAATLERKYRKENPGAWDKMVSLAYNATLHDIDLWGGNKHFGKEKKQYWQAKALTPQLKAEMRTLPGDLQSFLHDAAAFYRDQQNLISLNQIKTLLKDGGIDEPGLAERIHADGLTEEDRARFAGDDASPKQLDKASELVKQLDKARELKRINGSYFPLRRYGEHIVSATHGIDVPTNATQVAPDTLQFTSKGNKAQMLREAKAFAEKTDLRLNGAPKMVYVDKADLAKVLEPEHLDAIPAIRIRLHNKEVHFAEGELAARRIEQDLRARDGFDVSGVRLKDEAPYAAHATLMSSEMGRLVDRLRKRLAAEREKDHPDQLEIARLNGTIDSLYQSTVAMRAGNRIQSTMLPRRNISGFSKDFTRTLAEYSDMAAGYLARLEHRPDVESALKEAYDYKDAHRNEATENTLRRDELYREIQNRVYGDDRYEHGPVATATHRLLQMSLLDKLGGVSYHVINALEPAMAAAPYIGGRHGFRTAYGKLTRAYDLIGTKGALLAGLRDTSRALKADHGFTDYVDFFKKNIAASNPEQAKALGELLDRLHDRGLLDKEAEFEVRFRAHPESSVFGRALDKADLVARQMGVAVESMNRAATGIAAYLAEMEKTGDHAKSMDYAFDVVHDTMGDYSRVNAAPAFNHPIGRLALQFKKYGQKQYYLLGKLMQGAVAGDREARKQLAGILFTHAVMAGGLGLPIEPIKAAVTGANVLGGTQFTWDDFEQEARRVARAYLGATGGEIAMRGLPRALGVDLSGRLGQDSLMTHGSPRSAKDSELKAWLFDTIAGAPAAQVLQTFGALRALLGGDLAEASKGVPIKAVHDVVAAGQGLAGKKTARGYEAQKPYSPGEAAIRALGFKPSRDAETSEMRAANYHQSVRQKADHDAFVLRWMEAKPSERGKLWGEVERWNKDRPREAQLTRAKLDAAAKQRATKVKNNDIVNGQQVNKYNRHIIDQNADIYAE